MNMKLTIEPDSKVPIYIQLEEQIRSFIAAGQLRPGEQLPTIRELAADLRVNYNTIARVYLELERDGIISTQRGRGTFVAGTPDKKQMARMREGKLRAIVGSALDDAHMLGYTLAEIATIFEEELARWQEKNHV
jgi:GntR family transcriptional regulator